MTGRRDIRELLAIMSALRDPDSGCPWDVRQDFASISNYTVEEAYEVADAIARGDVHDLRDELGDLLFQVVFHAQMASENGDFGFDDVVEAICTKLIDRHPHVFADTVVENEAALERAWEQKKREERARKPATPSTREAGLLYGVASSLPALRWSEKLQHRAAQHGFDWPDVEPVFAKLDEEIAELRDEIDRLRAAAQPGDAIQQRIHEETGDVLFACVNIALHLKVKPEQALRDANRRFIERFEGMERLLSDEGKTVDECTLDELERYWQASKAACATGRK